MKPHLVEPCILIILDSTEILLTEEQFLAMMKEFPEIEEQIDEFESPDDTQDREALHDCIARHLLKRHWPLNGDKLTHKQFQDFLQQLKVAAIKAGYELCER